MFYIFICYIHLKVYKCPEISALKTFERQWNFMPKQILGKIIYSGILLSYKKNEIFPFVTMWKGLESIIPSEINQVKKDKNHMISLMGYKTKSNK